MNYELLIEDSLKKIRENKVFGLTPENESIESKEVKLKASRELEAILNEKCDAYYKNIICWNKNHTFTTEIDYIAICHGYLIFIKTKAFSGDITIPKGEDTIKIKKVLRDGEVIFQRRRNPVVSVAGFSRDFFREYKNSLKISARLAKKLVIFTNPKAQITDENSDSDTRCINLKDFNSYLDDLINTTNTFEITLPKLAQYDSIYSKKYGVLNTVVLSDNIFINDDIISIKDIKYIIFDPNFINSCVYLRNGKKIIGRIDLDFFKTINNDDLPKEYIDFLELNEYLHR